MIKTNFQSNLSPALLALNAMATTKINWQSVCVVIALSCVANGAFAHGDEDHSKDDKKGKAAAVTSTSDAVGANSDAPQRLADGSLFLPKPVQRQIGVRTQPIRITELAAAIELNGKIIAEIGRAHV